MMTVVAALIIQGAFLFVEADAPGVQVGGLNSLTGKPALNFRHADITGNGLPDLVFADRVVVQETGGVDTQPLLLPETNGACLVDVWEDTIYRLFSDRIELIYRDTDGWTHTVYPLAAGFEPASGGGYSFSESSMSGPQLSKFLHDIAEDGVPEVVLAEERGLRIYALGETAIGPAYVQHARHAVFPGPRPAIASRSALWPPEARTIAIPTMEMACRFFLDGPRLTVIERESLPDQTAVYRVTRHLIDAEAGFALQHEQTERGVTEPLPDDLQPCRLNDDDTIDFAGGAWTLSSDRVLPAPVFETTVTTDGGQTMHHVRTRSFRPLCLLIDFNGNGRRDLIAESTGLIDGGIRESVTRFTTQRSVTHYVQVHLQTENGTFPSTPDIRGRFTIQLERPPMQSDELFHRYQAGELVNVTGDFDGDGYRDLVIQDRPDRLAIYRGGPSGFATTPFLTLPIEPGWRFAIADIDGDGRSDIVVRYLDAAAGAGMEGRYVFLTRPEEVSP